MSLSADRGQAFRWLLPVLVALLALGHVCDLSAFAPLDTHHHHPAEGHDDELVTSCHAVPATSSSGRSQVWASPDIAPARSVVEAPPARSATWSLKDLVTLIERPPLFLLHASFLI